MTLHLLLRLACLSVMLAGCAHETGGKMLDHRQDLGRNIDALAHEDLVHATEVVFATTLQGVADAEARHWRGIDDHLRRMSLVMGDMVSCTDGRGRTFDTAELARIMQELRAEQDAHRSQTGRSNDLAAARTEESRHQEVMGRFIDGMQGQWETMMDRGETFACSHCRFCAR